MSLRGINMSDFDSGGAKTFMEAIYDNLYDLPIAWQEVTV